MSEFNRQIGFYESHFKDFYKKQSLVVRKKIDWALLLIKTTRVISENHLKHLKGTNGLWEIRISAGTGISRLFRFFDEGNLIILLHGFQKKTQKTPKKEIKKAEKLKKKYYENR